MQLPPVEVILSWPTANYVDPKDVRGPQLSIITFILFPIALITVALRTFTRIFISKSFGVDDWFLLAAVLPTTACAVLTIMAVQRWGWNRHIWDVPLDWVTLGLKLTITVECAFAIAVSLTKMSMLILTRRMLTNGVGIMRHIAAILLFVVASEALIFCVVVSCACSPPSAYWTLSELPQKCINEKLHLVIGGTINTITDFGVVLLPLPIVLSLKINRNQQIILVGLFGAGFIICIAGIFRIYFSYKTATTFDRTWVSFGLWISSVIELYLGVICTALPACKPFFSRHLPAFFGSSYNTSSSTPKYASGPAKEPVRPQLAFISQEERLSQNPDFYQPFELQNIPKSKFNTTNPPISTSRPPLSHVDRPEDAVGREEMALSKETSISSFVGGNPSPASDDFSCVGSVSYGTWATFQ